jgi:hypothetical protein
MNDGSVERINRSEGVGRTLIPSLLMDFKSSIESFVRAAEAQPQDAVGFVL